MIQGNETVIIERKTKVGENSRGNAVWNTTQTPVNGALTAWGSTSTTYDPERTLIASAATVYLPEGTEVLDSDVFIIRGKRYLKDGEAQQWTPPPHFSLRTGVVVVLKRVEG